MNPFLWSFRSLYAFGALCCAGLLGFALYVQHGMLMNPCNLCVLQRLAFLWAGVFFLLGALHAPKGRMGRSIYAFLSSVGSAIGAAIAVWHLRLQFLPPSEVPSCNSMDLGYLIGAFSPGEVFDKVFTATGDCAKVDWVFLGITMPGWTLLWYAALLFLAWYAVFRPSKKSIFAD